MDINEIRELIRLIEKAAAIEEFEMERSGVRIKVRKRAGKLVATAAPVEQEAPVPEADEPSQAEPQTDESLHIFTSPIVGTFYVSPKPDADPFAKPGDHVSKGTVLCIIEAMKIFNQIESDIDGVIVRRLAENGQAVEYGQPLFAIRLD